MFDVVNDSMSCAQGQGTAYANAMKLHCGVEIIKLTYFAH